MRKWLIFVVLLTVAASVPVRFGSAQEGGADVSFSKHRHFLIPFKAGAGANKLKQLQLFVSTDQGQSWQPSAAVPPDLPPDKQNFPFICEHDGLYWFTVQTTDKDGKKFPATLDGAKPNLKVMVDSLAPEVKLSALAAKNGEVGVTWQIKEEHIDLLDPKAVRLEFRPLGAEVWFPLDIDRAINQYFWEPQTNAILEVRLKVTDRAGNLETAYTKVGLKGTIGANPNPNPNPGGTNPNKHYPGHIATGPDTVPANRKLVNSKKISLNYKLEDVGPSGVSVIELWFTTDGRSWNKYPLAKSDNQKIPNPLTFDVSTEGVYGFTLLAKSGVGLGVQAPQIGDEPQVWIEVDLTKPHVKVQKVIVGKGADKGKLFLQWFASDKNLTKFPINLSYAEQTTGPWQVIAQEHANSGHYTWKMPEPVPYQFYIRVEARDLAGNVGEDIMTDLIKVDLSQPKVNILDVSPAGGN